MRYKNPYSKRQKRTFFHVLLWFLGYYKDDELPPLPSDFVFPNPQEEIDPLKPTLSWINHSTFLVKVDSFTFLTDPIWSARCSPFSFMGPKRHIDPPFSLASLSNVDFVVLSHDHYDHLDHETVLKLDDLFPHLIWVVPIGVKAWFKKHLPSKDLNEVVELKWHETFTFKRNEESISFTSVPAQHFSGRFPFQFNKTLWMGCVVESKKGNEKSKHLYFAGDTGYNETDFKAIGQKYGPFDLSLIPIGAYQPRGFMSPVHINPKEAVLIHKDVKSILSLGSHFGTFKLSDEELTRPPFDLYLALKEKGVDWKSFRVLNPGQVINW